MSLLDPEKTIPVASSSSKKPLTADGFNQRLVPYFGVQPSLGAVPGLFDVQGRPGCAVDALEDVAHVSQDLIVGIAQAGEEASRAGVWARASSARRAPDDDGLLGEARESDEGDRDILADPVEGEMGVCLNRGFSSRMPSDAPRTEFPTTDR